MSRITSGDLSDHNHRISSPPIFQPQAPTPDQPALLLQDDDPYNAYQDEYEYEEYHEPPTTPPTFDPAAILDSTAEYHRRYFPQPLNSSDRYLIQQPKHNGN